MKTVRRGQPSESNDQKCTDHNWIDGKSQKRDQTIEELKNTIDQLNEERCEKRDVIGWRMIADGVQLAIVNRPEPMDDEPTNHVTNQHAIQCCTDHQIWWIQWSRVITDFRGPPEKVRYSKCPLYQDWVWKATNNTKITYYSGMSYYVFQRHQTCNSKQQTNTII